MTELAATAPLSVTFIVNADDLVATNEIAERDGPPLVYLAAGAFVLIGAVLFDANPVLGMLIAAFGIAAGAQISVPAFRRFWLGRVAGTLLGERRDFIFDAEGVHEVRAGIRHTTPWTALTEMRIAPAGVFLFRHNLLVQALPTRSFPSPDALDRLIGLVSTHASHMRIT